VETVSGWPYWLRVLVLLGLPLAMLWSLLMAFIFNCTETGRQYKALERRRADPDLWYAQRMAIVAEKAPHLHAEILRAKERNDDAPLP
jgi:hypothetical protein